VETKRLAAETTKRMNGGSWSTRKAPLMIESPKDS
jgi:large subunit ribosomal protein L32